MDSCGGGKPAGRAPPDTHARLVRGRVRVRIEVGVRVRVRFGVGVGVRVRVGVRVGGRVGVSARVRVRARLWRRPRSPPSAVARWRG